MNITATRNEAPVGIAKLFSSKKAVDPTSLVNNALGAFQEAADNLQAAQTTIAEQKVAHQEQIAQLQAKADECEAQSARLTRVQQKINDLLN